MFRRTATAIVATMILGGGVALVLPAAPAFAASCSLNGTTLSVGAAGETVTIKRSASNILVNGAPCGTVTTVDTIAVTGSSGDEVVNVDLTGGPFTPGATAETKGVSEIEFTFDLQDGNDTVDVIGTNGSDRFDGDASGIDMTNDPDDDLALDPGVETWRFDLGGGNDSMNLGGVSHSPFPGTVLVFGGSGADDVTTGSADDVIHGETGNDHLNGGLGDDFIDGGGGVDTLDFDAINDQTSVTVDLIAGTATGADIGSDTLSDIDNVVGGNGDDTILGSNGKNTVSAKQGNDFVDGRGGNDIIHGGQGDDQLDGSGGSDTLYGDEGTDTLDGGAQSDVCHDTDPESTTFISCEVSDQPPA